MVEKTCFDKEAKGNSEKASFITVETHYLELLRETEDHMRGQVQQSWDNQLLLVTN